MADGFDECLPRLPLLSEDAPALGRHLVEAAAALVGEAVEGIRQGHEDVKAGRSKPADQFLDEFARKHGLPR